MRYIIALLFAGLFAFWYTSASITLIKTGQSIQLAKMEQMAK